MLGSLPLALLTLCFQDVSGLEAKLREKVEEGETFLKTAKEPREFRVVVQECLTVVTQAAAEDLFEVAAKALATAEKAARPLKDVALARTLKDKGTELTAQKREYDRVKASMTQLNDKPDDPAANLTVGRYIALNKGQWDRAINHLRKGSDADLRVVAELDSANPTEPDLQTALADKWWSLDKKGAYRDRAIYWYQSSWPKLTGLAREKVRTRAREYAKLPATYELGGKEGGAVGWGAFGKNQDVLLDDTFAHSGKRSAKLFPVSAGAARVQSMIGGSKVPAQAGKKYRLTAWVFTDGVTGAASIGLHFTDPGSFHMQPCTTDFPFWKKVEIEATASATATFVNIHIAAQIKTGRYWVDTISIIDEDGRDIATNGGFED